MYIKSIIRDWANCQATSVPFPTHLDNLQKINAFTCVYQFPFFFKPL